MLCIYRFDTLLDYYSSQPSAIQLLVPGYIQYLLYVSMIISYVFHHRHRSTAKGQLPFDRPPTILPTEL